MCIIIVRPPGETVTRAHLKESFRINSDGAGFMFDYNDKVTVLKGWFGFRQFYKDLRACEARYPDSTFVIHFRIGTSGQKDEANCHPFCIAQDAGFAHNGIMYSLGNTISSDTKVFVDNYLKKLPPKFWDNQAIIDAITECAEASHSKYVLLTGDGSYFIFNDKAGHWYNGCWYSNYSYVLPTKSTTPSVITTVGNTLCDKEYDGDIKICTLCHKEIDVANTGYHRWGLKLCKTCLNLLYGRVHVRCETCLQTNALTPTLLFSNDANCEYCNTPMSSDDTAWQLIASVMDD